MAEAVAGITVYNLPPSPPNLDRLGVFYIAFCITWTTIVVAGMVFCWWNRRNPILRVRGISLSFPAITLLHLYWILGQLAYPVGASMPTVIAYDVQYFAMGIWLPLGIALFQASNLRFLHVAKMQKQYAYPERQAGRKCNGGATSLLSRCRLRNMDYMKRTMIFIGIGMVVQCIITIAMWLACRKYHPTYGIPGTEIKGATVEEQIVYLGRGWEWWQSVLWQVIWTWIAAPILIWKAWGIRDTMGWRTQTIACCISGLHATPMFMAATYAPAFAKVNVYFPQSQWIHVSVMMWEIFTIFVPVYEVIRLWTLNKKTQPLTQSTSVGSYSLSTIIGRSPSPVLIRPTSSTSVLAEKGQSVESIQEYTGDRLYTKEALEHVLSNNPTELQEFAALSDFSGENIAFLSAVAAWKSRWSATLEEQQIPMAFNEALHIYADFISPQDAEFPLNISSHSLKQIQPVFEKPARMLFGEKAIDTNDIAPFESGPFTPASQKLTGEQYAGIIPGDFDISIFNDIEDHIKDLVLTNTWARFAQSMRRRSNDTHNSGFTDASKSSLRSWISETRMKLSSSL